MGKGQAQGPDREYQAQCRDVLVRRDPLLSAYHGDGIDVAFQAGGTTWTLDVALRQPTGEVVVAECRRRKDPVKQEDLGAFAYKVEVLRDHLGVAVAGIFFAKTAVQLGAVKVGTFEGIEVAVVAEDLTAAGVPLVFHRYDEERAKRTRHYVLEALPGHLTITGSLEAKLIRDGKVVEER